ncbi:hypothetical protein GR160_01395 [Flavobacterium sp. Sd200]|uniref:hypothetical protein n=1 Tax=Flavobacterium sp. Sd200 TaxID=2692211 RepID=UPI00136A933F|nr:hypothetical protein [Flavobacterium sp. Sd200]MXN89868.1 hypothetical protein [Flavobacterium sp. Sd200]
MATTKQTPAPKADSGKPLHKQETPELKKAVSNAEKGSAAKVTATKTPQKIQDGNTSQKKREY